MRLTERRENGGKRKQRHIERKKQEKIRVGKEPPKKEREPCRERETGQTTTKEVCRVSWLTFIWADRYGILPVCPPLVTTCPIYGTGGHGRLSAPAQMDSEKKKIDKNPVKAPLRHKHKRNGSCVICLKRLFVQARCKALSPLMWQSEHVCAKLVFGQWCSEASIRFYGKSYVWGIKKQRIYF